MNCERMQELLVDFLYGELDPATRAELQRHLDGCPGCAQEVARLEGVLRLYRAQPKEEPSEQASQRILHLARAALDQAGRQRAEPAERGWWRWLLSPAAVTAVLALAVVSVGLLTYLGSGEQPVPSSEPAAAIQARAVVPVQAPAATESAQLDHKDLPAGPKAPAPKPPAPTQRQIADSSADRVPSKPAARLGLQAGPAADAPDAAWSQPKEEIRSRRQKAAKRRPAASPTVAPAAEKLADKATGRGRGDFDAPGLEERQVPLAGATTRGSASALDESSPDSAIRSGQAGSPAPAEQRFAQPPPAQPGSAQATLPRREVNGQQKKTDARPDPARPQTTLAGADREADDRLDRSAAQGKAAEAKAEAGRIESEVLALDATKDQRPDACEQALTAMAEREYDQAAVDYRNCLARSASGTRASEARFQLARALFLAGHCQQAIAAIDQAVRAAPRHRRAADALLDQASCQVQLGRFDQAARTYQRIEREHPERASEARRERMRIQQ